MSDRPFPTRLFLFAFFGWTFDFYDLVLLGFLKEDVGKSFHLNHQTEAWMLGVTLGTSGLGGIVCGALADRVGKRTMLSSTILLYSAGSVVAGLAPNLWIFLIGRGIVGLGVGGEWAIGHAMVAEAMRKEMRGRGSALLQAGEPVGVALAAIAGYLIAPHVGWRAVMVGSAVTGILALFARRSMHLPNEVSVRTKIRSRDVLPRLPLLLGAWLLGVFKLGTYWTCYTWLPSFLIKEMHQGTAKSLAWVGSAQVGQFAGMLSFGLIADRFGRRPAFSMFSVITACAIAPLAYEWRYLSERPPLFWLVMVTLGFGSGCTAGFGALLAELYPTELRSLLMGTTYNLARAAQLGAPVLVAWAVAGHGLAGGLTVPLVLALLTATWVWVLPETRGIALPSLAAPVDSKPAPSDPL